MLQVEVLEGEAGAEEMQVESSSMIEVCCRGLLQQLLATEHDHDDVSFP